MGAERGGPGAVLGSWYDRRAARVEAYLDRILPPADEPPADLHEAMRYAVLGGGKRLRPVLLMTACEAVGGDPEAALPAAAAVELVHAYSLVHDDLPSMDDDAFRRGRPTVHVLYGEALAILVGDALLTLAFELIARELPARCGTEAALWVAAELGRAAGSRGLIAGQVGDLALAGRDVAPEELERVHAAKTGALFGFCLRAGGRIGGASEAELEALDRYARAFGLAFQIVDDVLDAAQDAGSQAGKATYATLLGVEEAMRRAREAAQAAQAAVAPLGDRARRLQELARFVVRRQA